MSEYISIETEVTDNPDVMLIQTNVRLTEDGREVYPDIASGEEGSPLAQALFCIDGIKALTITANTLTVTRNDSVEWFILIDEVNSALKDFFL